MQCLGYLGQGTTPLVLLALGVALRPGAALSQPKALALACAIKLLFVPLRRLGVVPGCFMSAEKCGRKPCWQSAMPAAVVASVLAGQNELEGDFAVGVVFAATCRLHRPLLLSGRSTHSPSSCLDLPCCRC